MTQDYELAMADKEDDEVKGDKFVQCGKDEDDAIGEEDFNWKAQMRPARNLSQPTVKEMEEHESLHMPYRLWCPHCVRGRGVSSQHKMRLEGPDEKSHRVPVIGMDYAFLCKNGEKGQPNPDSQMFKNSLHLCYMGASQRCKRRMGCQEDAEVH